MCHNNVTSHPRPLPAHEARSIAENYAPIRWTRFVSGQVSFQSSRKTKFVGLNEAVDLCIAEQELDSKVVWLSAGRVTGHEANDDAHAVNNWSAGVTVSLCSVFVAAGAEALLAVELEAASVQGGAAGLWANDVDVGNLEMWCDLLSAVCHTSPADELDFARWVLAFEGWRSKRGRCDVGDWVGEVEEGDVSCQ